MDLGRWRGRVALVTGASSGIGRAVAERLAAAHMRVVVCARRRARQHQRVMSELDVLSLGADTRAAARDMRRRGDVVRVSSMATCSPRSITRARSGRGRLTRAIRCLSRATSRRPLHTAWPSRVTSRFTTSRCARPSSLPEETRS